MKNSSAKYYSVEDKYYSVEELERVITVKAKSR